MGAFFLGREGKNKEINCLEKEQKEVLPRTARPVSFIGGVKKSSFVKRDVSYFTKKDGGEKLGVRGFLLGGSGGKAGTRTPH